MSVENLTAFEVARMIALTAFRPLAPSERDAFAGASDDALISDSDDSDYVIVIDSHAVEIVDCDSNSSRVFPLGVVDEE